MFGPFVRPYSDNYKPNPFSRSFVRHLPGWYAEKHPDEDFAETFAVWLDPRSCWREAYAGWKCLLKLQYVDDLASTVGRERPPVTADNYDTPGRIPEQHDRRALQRPGSGTDGNPTAFRRRTSRHLSTREL